MRVLYGVQGTGNGHLTRARALVPAMRKAGIEMDFIFSGRAREDFFDMNVFGDDFRCFGGLSLITEKGRLNTWRTITECHFSQFVRDVKNLNLDGYDLVISDFEPVTAWASLLRNKPSIGISHQCAFSHPVPKVSGYLSARLLLAIFAPMQIKIGLHWHHFNQPILPPLIHHSRIMACRQEMILVYMPFEDDVDVLDLLRPFTRWQFIVYSRVKETEQHGHIVIKPLSGDFHKDLDSAAGVISNAGFELPSECLLLGKKLLVKPLLGQYEQLCNALALQQLQRATVMQSLNKVIVQSWLELPVAEPVNYPDTAQHIAKWLARGEWNNTDTLLHGIWDSVNIANSTSTDMPGLLPSPAGCGRIV